MDARKTSENVSIVRYQKGEKRCGCFAKDKVKSALFTVYPFNYRSCSLLLC